MRLVYLYVQKFADTKYLFDGFTLVICIITSSGIDAVIVK